MNQSGKVSLSLMLFACLAIFGVFVSKPEAQNSPYGTSGNDVPSYTGQMGGKDPNGKLKTLKVNADGSLVTSSSAEATATGSTTPTPTFTGSATPTPTFTNTKTTTPYVAIQATDTPTYTSAQLTATPTPTPALETAKILASVATPVATPVVTAITTPRAGYVTGMVVRTATSTGTNAGSLWVFKGATGYPTYKIGVGGGFSYLLYSDGGNRNLGIGLPGELASEVSVNYYHIYWPYGQTPPAWFLE